MLTPISIARSGFIASGNVGWPHHASGSVRSGHISTTGAPDATKFLDGTFAWATPGAASVGSGDIGSGKIASGAVQGFFGTTRHIASGTVGVFDFGSGAVVAGTVGSGAVRSGNVASGQIGRFHIASGQLEGFELGSGAIVSGRIASGQIGRFHIASGQLEGFELGSGAIVSGRVASGQIGFNHLASNAVDGFFGTNRHIRSGTVGVFDFGSGAVVVGTIGSGAVVSGNVASGQIGRFHIASGRLEGFELGSGAIVSGRIASGQIGFNHLASNSVDGFFGTNRHVRSGTVGVFDFGSGAVIAGTVGSGAVQSGNITSGALYTYHFGSGAATTRAQEVTPIYSGGLWTAIAAEPISGLRAVCMNQSGQVRIAMASVSGRMPAIGVVFENVASGINVNVHAVGANRITASGIADYSGRVGDLLYVGRSGHVVTQSGSHNSGGLQSGDIWQPVGMVRGSLSGLGNAQDLLIESTAQLPFVPAFPSRLVLSIPTGELISGVKAVAWNNSGGYSIVRAERQSGLRLPAFGVTVSGAASGTACDVVCFGVVYDGVSGMTASGFHGMLLYVGSGGLLTNRSGFMEGASSGAPWISGSMRQTIGFAISGGLFVNPDKFITRSGAFLHDLPTGNF